MRITSTFAAIVLLASPVVAQDWNGAYVGVQAGGQWGSVSVTDSGSGVPPGPFEYDISGAIGGVDAGYNWMPGTVLLGVEASLSYMSVDGELVIPSASSPGQHQDLTLDSGVLAELTGRVGFAFDNTLLYGKGGVAYYTGEANQDTTKVEYSSTPTGGFTGLVLGAGVEHFVTEQLSLKAEYAHYAFGAEEGHQTALVYDFPTQPGTLFPNSHEWGIDTVKVGLNFHFD